MANREIRKLKTNKKYYDSVKKLYDDCEEVYWNEVQITLSSLRKLFDEKKYNVIIQKLEKHIQDGKEFFTERICLLREKLSDLKERTEKISDDNLNPTE